MHPITRLTCSLCTFQYRLILEGGYENSQAIFYLIGDNCNNKFVWGPRGIRGQYVTPSSGNASRDPSQYTEFYAMTAGPANGDPIGAPQQFETSGIMPTTVYLGEQMQPVPYSQYWSSPAHTIANSLWIKGITSWIQYAVVPQGATVTLVAFSPTGGIGTLTVVDSSGQTSSKNYIFYPNSIFTFYTYTNGRHILSLAVNGQSSNQVVIDAVGTCAQPGNYPGYCSLSDYYSGECEIYPWNTYWWHYYEHLGLL